MYDFFNDYPTYLERLIFRKHCECSLKLFIRFVYLYIRRTKFTFLPFHNDIIKALEDIAFNKTNKNLMINIPVGFGKSAIIQCFISWCLARNKNVTFLYTSYSDDLITKHSSEIKDILNSQEFNSLWGYEFLKDKNSKSNWSIKGSIGRSGLTAGAMGGTITGLDAGNPAVKGFCGSMIIDDPIKATDVIFENARNDCIYKYQTGLKTRLRRADVPTIVIMQRLHEDDLAGFILKSEQKRKKEGKPTEWDIITIKALVDEKSIWEEKVSTQTLIDEREDAPWVFYAQRQQEPNTNINTNFKGLEFTDNENLIFNGIGHIDKGFGGTDGTAFTILKQLNDNEYIMFGKYWKKHIDDCINDILYYRQLYKCGTIHTENNDDKGYLAKNNRGFLHYHEDMNKHFKIMSHLYTNWKKIKFIKSTDDVYIKQIQTYNEKAKNDDCPDSAASIIKIANKPAGVELLY